MTVFAASDFNHHERVLFCNDSSSGLNAIIAIHSTALGPAVGGCRMWPYQDDDEAIQDVLRLSRGMSYKNAMAELPLGGGKAVIIGDPGQHKSRALLEAFGKQVEHLGGDYVTAEDVGINVSDMEIIASQTRHVSGLPQQANQAGGDPSPKTAYGVFLGILAAVGFQINDPDRDHLKGIRIAVQGLGAVGHHLCRYLHEANAELIVSDIDEDQVDRVCAEMQAKPVDVNQILYEEVDVLAPCAMGAILNSVTIPKIKATIIAGAANNQLANGTDGVALAEQNILYAPDYVINAGGIINVAYEHLHLGNEQSVLKQIDKIAPRLTDIFTRAEAEGQPTHLIADAMAKQYLSKKLDVAAHAA